MKYPNLKAEMARYGVSQMKIAELIGCHHATVGRWIKGDSDNTFSIEQAVMIQEKFFPECDLRYLFSGNQ